MSQNTETGTGRRPRQPRPTGEVPALPPVAPPMMSMQEMAVIAAVATELLRVGQDLAYPLARHEIKVDDDLGAAFTRTSCASRLYGAAARLTQLITPADSPELNPGE